MESFEKLDVNVGKSEARLTRSDYSQIVFTGIQDHYDLGAGGLDCTFELPELFNACRDDWVGIFPVGWSTTSDKICFLRVNLPDNYQSGRAFTCRLQFSGLALPGDEGDFYQFCYVTALGLVRGTSGPWQVCHPGADDFVTEEDTDEDVMIIRRRTDTLEDEIRRLREDNALLGRKVDATKADFDSLTAKYADKVMQLKSAVQATEQMKLQLAEKSRKLECMETESRDMTVLQTALDEQIKTLSQEREQLMLRVDEGMTQVRGLLDRLTQLLSDKDALDGLLKQANDEKHLLKEQLCSVEEKLRQASLDVCKVKMEAEVVKQAADNQLTQRNITIDSLQQELAELKARHRETVDCTRNQLEAMSKSKAMVQDECGRLQQCLQAATEDTRVQLAASEDRAHRAEGQCRNLGGKLEEALGEWASHAAHADAVTLTLQRRDEQIAALQQEVTQLRESFVSHTVEVAAAYEGPHVALKQAYDQLKDRLNKEVDHSKTLTADINKLKKKLASRCATEASVQREVDDLKSRLAMSEEVYTQAVVKCKTLKAQLKRQLSGVEGDAGGDGDDEVMQLRADNARLRTSVAALQDHYREEMDTLRHKYDMSQTHCLQQLAEAKRLAVSGGECDAADGPSTNHVADAMGDVAGSGLQAPLVPLPPPAATDLAAAAPNADEDKFEDAVGEVTATCQVCQQVFTGPDAPSLCFIHWEGHTVDKCPVCDTFFHASTAHQLRAQHVNSHFTD